MTRDRPAPPAPQDRRDPIRVALVSPNGTSGLGGISRFCAYLERRSAEVPDVDLSVHRTIRSGRPVLRMLAEPYVLTRFALRCRRNRFDVVHVNIAPGNSTWRKQRFVAVARNAGCATVAHLHGSGYDEWYASLAARRAARVRRFFRSVDHVIVCGRHWYDLAVEQLGVDPSRVTIIPNGVPDTGEVADPTRAQARMISLGLLGERKGTDVLLHALARLPDDLDWRADLAGPGDLATWTAIRDELGLTARVSFPGWWPEQEARTELAASDVFVLATRRENQPVAIVEAMAAGIPVVSTAIAAIPEVVEDGTTGLIVPADDPGALVQALESLLRDPARRAEMGRRARERYELGYTIERSADRIHTIYRTLSAVAGRETEGRR
ncbi:MAG: glycosyltransferase family 4 protein [Ilumatobacteraceae bacterium]